MLTAFQFCREEDLSESESKPLVREYEVAPAIGQRLDLGNGDRWEIVKLEPFSNGADTILIAYLNRSDLPLLPEQDWDCNRWDRQFEFDGGSLGIVFWEDGRKTLMYLYGDDKPVLGELIPNFKPDEETGLLTETSPYDTFTKIETYQPQVSSYYKFIYACWNQEVQVD